MEGSSELDGAEISKGVEVTRKDEILMKREQKKREDEENLTFKPKIKNLKGSGPTSPEISSSRFDKLYSSARKKQEEEIIKQSKPPEDTFKPKLVTNQKKWKEKRAASPGNVVDRLTATKSPQRAHPEQYSFQPTISEKASSLDRNSGGVDVMERLYSKGKDLRSKHEKNEGGG